MNDKKKLAVLITGAGSGMGLHTARTLALQGHKVYAGIRDPDGRNIQKSAALRDDVESRDSKVDIVDLDIHLEDSCQKAADTIMHHEGAIDVVIHNAAHLFIGYAEAFTPEQIASAVNTNVIGAHRLNRAVLPYMRARKRGLILYVGSGITNVTAPFMAPYVIGKAGLDALAENTAYEISQFGVETTILMPGVFLNGTSHFETAEFPKDKDVLKDYGGLQKD
ncbi:SDR family NAD(P)-dependent oxidoreductase [Anditalea andensis]|uniref:SDR family NAD(P)-dependent oxidoreductase n=1 Tax=Anditalea andensis TaxID=1048983 RepID=UPI000A548799|nr:SDR family NAD(P)-dependent oxidoreductase [Anditalea andensis]